MNDCKRLQISKGQPVNKPTGRRQSGFCFFFCWLVLCSLSCSTDNPQEQLSKGIDLLYDGRYEDAESHFLYLARELSRSSLSEVKLYQAKALYHAARIERLYLGQPRRAVTRFREALELAPNATFAFDARREIALIFHDRLRDYRSAVIELEYLVQSFPDREDVDPYRFRIAQCYFLLRDFDQARSVAQSLLERKTNNRSLVANAMLLVANSYYVQGNYQEAVEAHKKLLAIQPGDEVESRSSFELGMCYLELGEYRMAEQFLLQALERHSRPDIVRYQLEILQKRMTEEDNQSLAKLPHATASRKLTVEVEPAETRSSGRSVINKLSVGAGKNLPVQSSDKENPIISPKRGAEDQNLSKKAKKPVAPKKTEKTTKDIPMQPKATKEEAQITAEKSKLNNESRPAEKTPSPSKADKKTKKSDLETTEPRPNDKPSPIQKTKEFDQLKEVDAPQAEPPAQPDENSKKS